MIEVFETASGWGWRMICERGRTLWEPADRFPCDMTAFRAARAYRIAFWAIADQVDHRMARCI